MKKSWMGIHGVEKTQRDAFVAEAARAAQRLAVMRIECEIDNEIIKALAGPDSGPLAIETTLTRPE